MKYETRKYTDIWTDQCVTAIKLDLTPRLNSGKLSAVRFISISSGSYEGKMQMKIITQYEHQAKHEAKLA